MTVAARKNLVRFVPEDRARQPHVRDVYGRDIEAPIRSLSSQDFVTTGTLTTFSDQALLGFRHLLLYPGVYGSRLLFFQLTTRSKKTDEG